VTAWRPVANAVLSALLAPPCAVCGRVLDAPLDGAVCDSCWSTIPARRASVFHVSPSIARGGAIGPYEGTLREIIHSLKYEGRRSVAPRLARLMAAYGGDLLAGADLVVPVPLHTKRLRERGFNQAEDLARGLGLPLSRALRRIRKTRPQVELPATTRQLNVRGAFALTGRPGRRPLSGATIVLVDDVTTTGMTLEACAVVLLAAGAHEVRALTAARVETAPRPSPSG
jgi:ComF family protein